ncbi:MAG TPA: hypothetical protein VJS11_14335 [Acidobacteriaceae bacterium]|nr:hypothetical protein [Acidobacteriaceae bacterium]
MSRLSFRGITRAVFARLRRKAAKHGIPVRHPRGEAARNGVVIQWNYDPTAEVLEVECVRTPFWIAPAAINSKLTEEIESELQRAA